jgi:hypothetical protein
MNEDTSPNVIDEVRKAIREETDKSNSYLELTQKIHGFYKLMLTTTGIFIAAIVFVALYFSHKSVNEMLDEIKGRAQSTIQTELDNVRAEVQKRVATEFQSPNIAATVRDVAKDKTEKELQGIIRSESSIQVEKAIENERPFIKETVLNGTRKAVKELEPTINSSVQKATEDQVHKSVLPIESKMDTYGDIIRLGTLATLAKSDDRRSFDILVVIASGKAKESKNPELQKIANSTITAVIREVKHLMAFSDYLPGPETPDSVKKILQSTNALHRRTALEHVGVFNTKEALSILMEKIEHDDSVSVVAMATERLNLLTEEKFDFWKEQEILNWWKQNQARFR